MVRMEDFDQLFLPAEIPDDLELSLPASVVAEGPRQAIEDFSKYIGADFFLYEITVHQTGKKGKAYRWRLDFKFRKKES